MASSNFYDILGVAQNANVDEIKRAYRKLSFIHHPDKNNSPESTQMFQKLAEAYSILSDPEKRQQYDMELKFGKGFGGSGFGGSRMFTAEINPHEIFNMFFGNSSAGEGGFGGLGGIFQTMRSMNGMGMGMGLGNFGGEIHIIHQSGNPAEIFGGGGGFNPFIMHMQQQQQHQQQQQQHQQQQSYQNMSSQSNEKPDSKQSKRKSVPPPEPIEKTVVITLEQVFLGGNLTLEYEKTISENDMFSNVIKQTLQVEIPKGIRHGEVITIPNVGNINESGVSGDINITIKFEQHPSFSTTDTNPGIKTRYLSSNSAHVDISHLDLFFEKTISLKESLCGFQFEFTHLNGKTYQIVNRNIGSVIQPESIKTIKGLGFQRMANNTLEHGSLHICFHVVYPDSITEDVQTALASILP